MRQFANEMKCECKTRQYEFDARTLTDTLTHQTKRKFVCVWNRKKGFIHQVTWLPKCQVISISLQPQPVPAPPTKTNTSATDSLRVFVYQNLFKSNEINTHFITSCTESRYFCFTWLHYLSSSSAPSFIVIMIVLLLLLLLLMLSFVAYSHGSHGRQMNVTFTSYSSIKISVSPIQFRIDFYICVLCMCAYWFLYHTNSLHNRFAQSSL